MNSVISLSFCAVLCLLDLTLPAFYYTCSRFIVALFPENVSSTTKQRPTTAGIKIKVSNWIVKLESQLVRFDAKPASAVVQ